MDEIIDKGASKSQRSLQRKKRTALRARKLGLFIINKCMDEIIDKGASKSQRSLQRKKRTALRARKQQVYHMACHGSVSCIYPDGS